MSAKFPRGEQDLFFSSKSISIYVFNRNGISAFEKDDIKFSGILHAVVLCCLALPKSIINNDCCLSKNHKTSVKIA